MSEADNREPGLWSQFKENRDTLLGIQVIVLIVSITITGPLLALILSGAIASSGQAALSDTAIVNFLFQPTGLLLAFGLGTVAITVNLYGYAAQLVSIHASRHGYHPTVPGSLSRAGAYFPALLRLALRFLTRMAVLAAPFVAAIAVLAFLQLRQHDINYYLDAKPPAFLLACGLALIILIGLAVTLLHQAIGWYFAMPLVLFGHEKPAAAHRISLENASGSRRRIGLVLILWLLVPPLLISISNTPWPPLAYKLTEIFSYRLGLLALALGVIFFLSTGIAIVIGFTALSLLSVHNVRLFRQVGLDRDEPPPPLRSAKLQISWKAFVAAALVFLIGAMAYSYRWLDQLDVEDNALIIAHRGASADAPENTMAAIELAVKAGADWVEIDVQETEAGEVVVIHDRDFMRVAGNPLEVRASTPEELAEIDIGTWFAPNFADQRTPSLREVLELCRGRSGVLIELKYYGQEIQLEQRVIDIVEEMNMSDQVMLMSLSAQGLAKVRELRPSWRIGLLSTLALGDLTKLDVDFLGLNARSVSESLLGRAHAAGIDVYAWTVNDPATMSSLLIRGVDGLISDVPALCRKIIKEREALNPGERLLVRLADLTGHIPPESKQ